MRGAEVQEFKVQEFKRKQKRGKITQRRRERGVSAEEKKEGHDISCPYNTDGKGELAAR